MSTIVTAGKYSETRKTVQTSGKRRMTARRSADLFIPTLTGAANRVNMADWYWKEIKEGGFLTEYLHSEKRRMPHMIRKVARIMAGFQQNNKSDFQRVAAIPGRLYHRWKGEDEHFFEDNENLRSLKRDNPDLPVYLAPRQLPTTRFRKVYRDGHAVSRETHETTRETRVLQREGNA